MKPNLQVQLCALAAVLGLSACEPTAPALPNDLAIRLAPARAFYPVGDTARAILTGTGLGGQQWRSLDTKVALVSLTGLISMVGEGVGTVEGKLDRRTVRIEFVVDGILRNRDIDFHETWSAAESPHVVDRPLVVQGPGGVVLTIEPGATVLFRPGSHLAIGDLYRGRLVIPSGTQPVVMAGDSAVRGSWGGLRFRGSGASELRNLTMRHCGASPPGGSAAGCIVASYYPTSFQSPSLLVDEVTVTEAVNYGLDFDNWVTFAPGSRNLTITD